MSDVRPRRLRSSDCDLRRTSLRPMYTNHLRRPVFCRCWPTSVELFANRN